MFLLTPPLYIYVSSLVSYLTDIASFECTYQQKSQSVQPKRQMHAHCSRQTPLYHNCQLLAPDGTLLSVVDHKKIQWYRDRHLGSKELLEQTHTHTHTHNTVYTHTHTQHSAHTHTHTTQCTHTHTHTHTQHIHVLVACALNIDIHSCFINIHVALISDSPPTLKLKFEPAGKPSKERDYYLAEKENICVVCGSDTNCIRKHIVPQEYRKLVKYTLCVHCRNNIHFLNNPTVSYSSIVYACICVCLFI